MLTLSEMIVRVIGRRSLTWTRVVLARGGSKTEPMAKTEPKIEKQPLGYNFEAIEFLKFVNEPFKA